MENRYLRPLVKALPLPLTLTPWPLQRLLLEQACQHALATQLAQGDLDFLQGKWLNVEITDAHWHASVTVENQRIKVSRQQQANGSIAGDTLAFLKLVTRHEDPDSLFFHRQISIKGDTALCLNVKNVLDQLDHEQLPKLLQTLLSAFNRSPLPKALFHSS